MTPSPSSPLRKNACALERLAWANGWTLDQTIRELAPTPVEVAALEYDWKLWARPEQLAPPGRWRTWLALAGRGWGKTRTGVEWCNERVEEGAGRLILAGPTAGDVRDVMVEGESGILAVSPPWNRPKYEPSKSRLTWDSGATAILLSADEPERFRGKQGDSAWCDELCSWRHPEAWDQLQLGVRLDTRTGGEPRIFVSTTPKPTKLLRKLLAAKSTVVTTGSTYDNVANLAASFLDEILSIYEGTRLGEQELYAKVLGDTPGALWKRDQLEALRVTRAELPTIVKIVVAVDPAVTDNAESDETGILVVGLGDDEHAYALEDLSGRYSPAKWAEIAVTAFHVWHANAIIAEVNQGGDLVEANLHNAHVEIGGLVVAVPPIRKVHAKHGKRARAEPVSMLYEQKRVHHVGMLGALEDQQTTWDASSATAKSPDRVDALVYGITDLMLGARGALPAAGMDEDVDLGKRRY